jgi:hypothetical protein
MYGMKSNQASTRGTFAAVIKGALAVLLVVVCGQNAVGQNLLQNGDFATDLNHWSTDGSVTGGLGRVTLSENGTAPVLYQAVDVSSYNAYAFELRFDLYVGDMSSSSGSGEPDRGRLSVLAGMDANSLSPDNAAEEIVLVEASAAGPVAIAANISGVPNPALGEDWYSVVVEFVADYPALAPYSTLLNQNGLTDSSLVASNVRFYALNRGRLANISNRGPVGTGASIMIPGFVIVGTTPKDLVFRGVGPTLGGFGVAGTIPDPTIGLFPAGATSPSVFNDNWGDDAELSAAFGQVGAFPLDAGSLDAAFVVRDLAPGAYTVQVAGVGGQTGVGLAEIYDISSATDGPTELTNISNRGFVGEDAAVQIPGFVITGTRGKKVLVRAVGPTLAGFGVAGALNDPFLELFKQGEEGVLMTNDNWEDNENAAQIAATAMSVGAFALDTGSADSSILTALEPGSYTAVARGVGGTTGVALVEVYMVTSNQRPVPFSNTLYVNSSQANTLDMDEILGNDLDPDGDLLFIHNFTDPTIGTLVMNDMDELVFTGPIGYFGESVFSYTVTDGEYESVPTTVALQVAPANAAIWVGGSSASFSDPANWKDGEVPAATDPVWIGQQGESNITVNQDATVASIRAGATGAKVTLSVSSGRTLTAAGGIEVMPGSTLEINNGTVSTNQDVLVHGRLVWNSGEMNGNASTIIATGATAEFTGGQMRLTGNRRFINRGDLVQTGSSYLYSSGGSNSSVTNAETGTWDLKPNNGTTFAYNDNSSTMDFVNAGSLAKTNTTGIVYFGTSGGTSNFTNSPSGTVTVDGGSFQLNGSGSGDHSGAINVVSGAQVIFARGTHAFASGATISDIGDIVVTSAAAVTLSGAKTFESLKIQGGTLTTDGTLTVGTFEQASGTLVSDENLVVTELLTWNSGVQSGEGDTVVGPDAAGNIASSLLYLRDGRGFVNQGEINQQGSGAFYADQGSQSTITNAADATWILASRNGQTFAYQDNSSTLSFVNDGTLEKTNASAIIYFGTSGGTSNFTNNGSLSILGGTFQWNGVGTGTHNGDLSIATGAAALFNRGTHSFDGESTISEDGELHVAGNAIVNLPGAYSFESLRIANGTLNASGDLTVATYVQTSGVYVSANDLIVTDSFTWNGGIQRGAGETSIGAEATGATSSGQLRLEGGRDLTNLGAFAQSGSGYFYSASGSQSTITNGSGATWDVSMSNGQTLAYQDGSSTMNFVNLGAFEKTNSTAIVYLGYTSGNSNITNEGSISIVGGTLEFRGNGTGTHGGDLSIASGATAHFSSGTHTFGNEATISDTGTVQLNSNVVVNLPGGFTLETLTISNGTLNAAGELTVGTYSQGNGTLSGSGDLNVTSALSWTGGTQTGTGTTVIESEATGAATSGQLRLAGGRKFTNQGEFNHSGSAYFYAAAGSLSTVTNANGATWNLSVNNNTTYAYNDNSSTMNFVNEGNLSKVNASGVTYFGTSGGTSNFTNNGTFSITGGTFLMNGTGSGTFGGTLSISAGGELRFDRGTHTFPTGAQISGDGLIQVYGSNATVTMTDGYTLKSLAMRNGVLNAGGAMTVESFSQINGTYSSSENLTVTDTFSFAGGTGYHSGSGDTIIGSEATATFSTGSFRLLSGRDLVNNGTMTQSGGTYFYAQGGTNSGITNVGDATWTLSSNNGTTFAYNDSSSSLTITNNGTMTKTSSGRLTLGTSSGSTVLVNNGSLDVSTGTMYVQGAAGLTLSNASTLTIQASTTVRGIEGNGDPLNFGGSLILKSTVTLPTSQAIRIIDFDVRNGTFNSITPPQGLTLQNTTYDDTSNNGFVEVTF